MTRPCALLLCFVGSMIFPGDVRALPRTALVAWSYWRWGVHINRGFRPGMSESLNMLIHGVQCLALLELACVALELECAALSAESAVSADGAKWVVSVSDSGATTGVSGMERLFVARRRARR